MKQFLNLTVRKLQSLNCTEEYLAQLTLLAADFSAFVGVLRNESFTHCMERSLHEKLGDKDFVSWKRRTVKEIQEEIEQSKEQMQANMARSKAAIEEQNKKMINKYSGSVEKYAAKGKAAAVEEEKPRAAREVSASRKKCHK